MSDARLPPGPKGHWLSGNLNDFRQDRLDFLTSLARDYGDVAAFRIAHRRVYLVSHPDFIEDVLVHQSKNFIKHFAIRLNPMVLGKGLLTSEGDFWLRQRRILQPVFNRSRITQYAGDMIHLTQRHIEAWRTGESRNMLKEMSALTLSIAAKTMFGAEVGRETEVVVNALDFLQGSFLRKFNRMIVVPMWVPTLENLRVRRAVRSLDEILYGFIRQRRSQPDAQKNDLLSLLLQVRDEDDGSGMNDQQVRDEAMTLFLAGHETTALALAWTWLLLGQHPEIEAKLIVEVDHVVGSRDVVADDWPKLKYAESVALESMRLYPPAYLVGREALSDCEVGGFLVPRGTTLMMSEWVVQRDPRFFSEPSTFRPERWLGEDAKRLPKFAYFPFGGGPRICIGATFAMMEMVLVLATIAQRFRFRVQPHADVAPLPTFTLRPATGIPGLVERR